MIYKKAEPLYISRKEAYTQLKLTHKDFKKLCILTNTIPVKGKNNLKFEHNDSIYYFIKDIQKMIDSIEYKNMTYKNFIKQKKQNLENSYQKEKVEYLPQIEYNYKNILVSKYKSFNEAVIGLNDSLNYYNEDFNTFVYEFNLLKNVYLTNNNIYFLVHINNIEIFYCYLSKCQDEYKYLYNLSYYHVQFVINKLKKVIEKKPKCLIFCNMKFKLHTPNLLLSYIIEYCDGKIDNENYDIYVSDLDIDDLNLEKKYVQPQFLFDCFNKKELLSFDDYKVGKILPKHEVPESSKIIIEENMLKVMSKTKQRKYDEYMKQ